MRVGTVGHLRSILQQWLAAWRTRRDNPLPGHWAAAEARRLQRQVWYTRTPGLLVIAVLLSALATWLIVEAAAGITQLGIVNVAMRLYVLSTLTYVAAVVLLAATLFCLCWLLARLGAMAQLALGFLERQPRQQVRQTLDDMLAVTRLSEQELLTGFVLYAVRQLNAPLICLSLLGGLAAAVLAQDVRAQAGLVVLVLLGLLSALQLYVGGVLAAVALMLMLLPLGLTGQAGLMPLIGARVQVVTQLALLGAGCYLVVMMYETLGDISVDDSPGLWGVLGFALPAFLALWLLFYLARRIDWLRVALGFGFPLIVAGLGLGLLGHELLSGDAEIGGFIMLCQAWTLQGLAVLSPQHLSMPLLGSASYIGWKWTLAALLVQWAVILLFQFGYIVVFAEFARDAIRRRKWSTA